jgi:hypothetical protein
VPLPSLFQGDRLGQVGNRYSCVILALTSGLFSNPHDTLTKSLGLGFDAKLDTLIFSSGE